MGCYNSVQDQLVNSSFNAAGEMVAYSSGANFTPHVITVAAGEVWL